MNLLITGGTGFIGSYLVKLLHRRGHNPILLKCSLSDPWRLGDLFSSLTTYDIDRNGLEMVFKNHQIDGVVHLATLYGHDASLNEIIKTNLYDPSTLAIASIKHKVPVFINTDTFYNSSSVPYDHLKVYTKSKRDFWEYLHLIGSTENTHFVNARLAHVFGLLDGKEKFVPWILAELLSGKSEIQLTSGDQKRDFIFVEDVAEAYYTIILSHIQIENFETIEIGMGKQTSIKELILSAAEIVQRKGIQIPNLKFGVLKKRMGEIDFMESNTSKLAELGWETKHSLSQGLEKTIAFNI